jgi:hypothetical protein
MKNKEKNPAFLNQLVKNEIVAQTIGLLPWRDAPGYRIFEPALPQ